jgi:hypothetical protein
MNIPNERKLDVRWSTVRWVPRIDHACTDDRSRSSGGIVSIPELESETERPFGSGRRRGQAEALIVWVRPGMRMGASTGVGNRSTWR